jgi:hypothetical protein
VTPPHRFRVRVEVPTSSDSDTTAVVEAGHLTITCPTTPAGIDEAITQLLTIRAVITAPRTRGTT